MSKNRKPRMKPIHPKIGKIVNPKPLWQSVFGSAILWSAAIGYASPTAAAPFTCDGTLYISQANATGDPTQLNDLVTAVDPFTFNPRGSAATEYNGMGFRVQDGFIYGVDPELANDPATQGIFRIDDTGVPVALGVPAGLPAGTRYIAGDFNANTGNYFILGLSGDLVEINVTTTPPTVVSTRTIQLPGGATPSIADIAFNPVDGNFYGFDLQTDRIVFFDPNATSPITVSSVPQGTGTPNVTSGANNIGATFFDASGTFFAYQNSGNLFRVDLATGIFTLLGNPPQVGQNDGAGCPIAPVIQKTVNPAAVAAGSTVTYTYTIPNQTDFTLSNLTFSDTMDSGRTFTSVVSNPFGGTISGLGTSTLTINNFTIPSRTTASLQVQVQIPATVPTPSTLFNQATVSGPGISSRSDFPPTPELPDGTPISVTAATADLSTVKTGVTTATAGSNVIYTIVVTNNGPNDAVNTVISDVIASGANFVAADNAGAFNATTGIVTWPPVTIPANTTATRTVTVNVPTAGVYTNTTTSTSDTPDPDPNNNSGSATTTVASGPADVQTTKTGAASLPAPGQITYTITTTNLDATNTAANVVISDAIAAGATFVSASDGGTFNAGSVTWPGVNIPANSSVTRTVTVNLPTSGDFTNTASHTSANDPNPGNNSGAVTTTVPPFGPADVQTTKSGPVSLPAPGEAIYTVSTTNNDTANTASNVVISDVIAPGASFVTASDGGIFNPVTRTVTWPATSVGPGQTVTRSVTVNLPTAGSFTNTSSNTSDNDPNPSNNNGSNTNAQVTTVVPNEPDLTINKSQTGAYVTGSTANYVLTITNVGAGPTNGSPVTVVDTLPAGLTPTGTFTAPGWTCGAAGQTITCTRSDVLAAGGSYPDINFEVTVAAAAGTTLINTSSINNGSGGETNFNNNSDPETIQVIGATDPDLIITKTASGNFTAGGTGTYILTVTNVGPGPTLATPATTVRVSDNLPAGVTVDGTPSGTGWNCTVVGQTVSCDRNDVLNSGDSYPPLSIPVRITAAPGANVTNTALVTGGGDPNPTNSGGQVTTSVGGLTTPLGLAKQVGTTVDNGDGTFTVPLSIIVQNFGGVPLRNVQVQENLANTFNNVSAFSVPSPPTVTGALTGANLNFNGTSDINLLTGTQTLLAGESATIAFNVNVTPGTATGPFNNIVTGSGVLPNNVLALDTSVNGINPDLNGNGNPGDDTGLTPISLSGTGANFRLVKRITNVTRNGVPLSGVDFSSFVDDSGTDDNAAGWSNLSPVGVPVLSNENVVQSDDEVEYTIYFLSDGTQAVTNARVCDLIPQQTTFIANSFGTSSGISVLQAGTTAAQTNAADGDKGQFFSPLTPVDSVIPPCTTGTNNPNGAVFVNLGTVPNSGTESVGFIRFRVRVD